MEYYLLICLLWACFAAYMQNKYFGTDWKIALAFVLNFVLMPLGVGLAIYNKVKYGSAVKENVEGN